jgi:Catalytic LigB subunit of aromatic ring-opening dioxygenase
MLGLGMASSHAPMMFQKAQDWPRVVERIPLEAREQLPRSARVEIDTPAIIEGHIQRIEAAFATLREQVRAYRPDALIMIGDDQGDMFDDANNPTLSIYTGDEPLWGRSARDPFSTPVGERTKLVFPQQAELARRLLRGLVKRGFDVANLGRFDPRGHPARGVSHMVSNLVPEVDPGLVIPLVCVFLNEYYPPLPSAARCAQLGEAIADVLRDRPERVAIYASGGLSHYPGMYNAGWIDQPLDHWILERLQRNDVEALQHLFTFDSDNLRSGTGEVRAWISVAAAMKRPATVVDYVPAHCAQTGCGFVYWPLER